MGHNRIFACFSSVDVERPFFLSLALLSSFPHYLGDPDKNKKRQHHYWKLYVGGGGITSSLLAALCLCRRIPLEDIPEDDDECSAWLHKLYQEKVSALGARGPFTLQLWVCCVVAGLSPVGEISQSQLLVSLELTLSWQ